MLFRLSRDERGFTMVTVVGSLLIVTLLAVTALSYAQNDLPVGAHDRDRKVAYAAAEAGAQNYLYYLSQDPNYWAKCTNDTTAYTTPPQINQRLNAALPESRTFVRVPNTTKAWYTIELLPANGAPACSITNFEASMIDATTGTFRIRTTGRAGLNGVKRSIVTTFKRQSLLDFIYFTDFETRSPALYPVEVGTRNTRTPSNCAPAACRDLKTWAGDECDRYYGDDTDGLRQNQFFNGQYQASGSPTGSWTTLNDSSDDPMQCNAINFIGADVVAGPFHTNDEFSCTGAPDFGRTIVDRIETASLGQTAIPAPGYRGCSPLFIGTHVKSAPRVEIPPTNKALYRDTAVNYRFVGRTQITMSGANMTVTGTRENGTALAGVSMPIPADGVVYVSNSAANKPTGSPGYACPGYNVLNTDALFPNDACGNLEIKGNYSVNVTLTAENDIVVKDDLTRTVAVPTPDALLGLISNNFIRIYHPVTGCGTLGCNFIDGCSNASGGPGSITIDAAILSLNHSFVTDNWHCGVNLGTLTVNGAIAQKFRGAVGRGTSGYTKLYSYDNRLRYRSPPKFLDPVQAAWQIQAYNEQVPAR
jgi:Tfp pilus assembly protein PilX